MRIMLAVVVAALATAVPALAAGPSVRVATSPFTVRGAGFLPAERVTVYVAAGAERSKTAVATSRGTFAVRFRSLEVGACESYVVRAVGNRGSRASVRHIPTREECGAPIQP
jgi:hypothetical protein